MNQQFVATESGQRISPRMVELTAWKESTKFAMTQVINSNGASGIVVFPTSHLLDNKVRSGRENLANANICHGLARDLTQTLGEWSITYDERARCFTAIHASKFGRPI